MPFFKVKMVKFAKNIPKIPIVLLNDKSMPKSA